MDDIWAGDMSFKKWDMNTDDVSEVTRQCDMTMTMQIFH